MSENLARALELGLKAHFGVLKGGGVYRTLKVASSLGRNDMAAVERLVARMMFDPELASHLLTRKVQEAGTPAWNARLQKISGTGRSGESLTTPRAKSRGRADLRSAPVLDGPGTLLGYERIGALKRLNDRALRERPKRHAHGDQVRRPVQGSLHWTAAGRSR